LAQLETLAQQTLPRFADVEKNTGRITCRIVNVFSDTTGIDRDWPGLKSLIQVERIGFGQESFINKPIITSAH